MKYSYERLIRVMNAVSRRTERRRQRVHAGAPLLINASFGWDLTTSLEYSVMHFCKIQIAETHAPRLRSEAGQRNQLVVTASRKTGIRRSELRSRSIEELIELAA